MELISNVWINQSQLQLLPESFQKRLVLGQQAKALNKYQYSVSVYRSSQHITIEAIPILHEQILKPLLLQIEEFQGIMKIYDWQNQKELNKSYKRVTNLLHIEAGESLGLTKRIPSLSLKQQSQTERQVNYELPDIAILVASSASQMNLDDIDPSFNGKKEA